MEVQCAGADEGGDAEGLRNGPRLATHPYPSNSAHPQVPSPAQKYWVGAVSEGGGEKGVGKRGGGADPMVSRVKAGVLRGADAAEAGHVKGKEPKGCKATNIIMGRSYSLSLVRVLVCIYKLVSSPALPQQTLVAFYYIPQPAATGGLFYGRRYY